MFDISLTEIAVVIIIALLVMKPEDVPSAVRAVRRVFQQLRDIAAEFSQVVTEASDAAGISEAKQELKEIVDLEGNIREAYDIKDIHKLREKSQEAAAKPAKKAVKKKGAPKKTPLKKADHG
ncbi:MAG: hypothetical protein KDD76_05685 [Rickettsiales bacterium]|nr:hypothetical protein [Rickettsiales bacterium]